MSDTTFTAETADRHRLYELSVQDTEVTIDLIETVFAHRSDRRPLALREDFCGTAQLCVDWLLSDPERTATGLDIDGPTLGWARAHNVPRLAGQTDRLTLLEADVLDGTPAQSFDVVCAFNFSYFAFHDRATLVRYFATACRDLADGGLLLLDLHGGPDAQFALEEATAFDGFDYVWEQRSFDPINNRTICHIPFRFDDGRALEEAFTYDWRLWTPAELTETLIEAGFRDARVYWEKQTRKGERTGIYHCRRRVDSQEAWVAVIAGLR